MNYTKSDKEYTKGIGFFRVTTIIDLHQHFSKVKNIYVIIRNIRGCVTHNYLATSFVLAFLRWQKSTCQWDCR